MLKSLSKSDRSAESASTPIYPDDIEPAVQDTLAVLANIDGHYLEHWRGPASVKERLAADLEEARRTEREPHVKLLAELHQRWMSATMFRGTLH
jgi:hypothetical protein